MSTEAVVLGEQSLLLPFVLTPDAMLQQPKQRQALNKGAFRAWPRRKIAQLSYKALDIKAITKTTRKIKKRIRAIPAKPLAIPPKPSTAAISAKTANVMIHSNMIP